MVWNPWHGCRKYSEGCRHCYVYRRDDSVGRDASEVTRNKDFQLPIAIDRHGNFKIPSGTVVFASMTSDFFLEEADPWREEAWDMIRMRHDLHFMIITKRILRVKDCLPPDWGEGYPHVTLLVTMENQEEADRRLPALLALPARHKEIICEPLLSAIDFHGALPSSIEGITVGGESGNEARPCHFEWVLSLRSQAQAAGIPFHFKQTGARFVKDGKLYRIPRKFQHTQAKKANL
ncbi:MAG: DUF5131 family protein [Clostridia bacterium]|nr:DUF5131 family protein [Clostridia bacterium]